MKPISRSYDGLTTEEKLARATGPHRQMIAWEIEAGRFSEEFQVIAHGLAVLERKQKRLAPLRDAVGTGLAALASGDFATAAEIAAHTDGLAPPALDPSVRLVKPALPWVLSTLKAARNLGGDPYATLVLSLLFQRMTDLSKRPGQGRLRPELGGQNGPRVASFPHEGVTLFFAPREGGLDLLFLCETHKDTDYDH